MHRKISVLFLAILIFNAASGAGVFAQSAALGSAPQQQQQQFVRSNVAARSGGGDSSAKRALIFEKNFAAASTDSSAEIGQGEKDNLANYEKSKARGKKLSTTTKVLIGVGVAAAVVGLVVFAASRDKIRTF